MSMLEGSQHTPDDSNRQEFFHSRKFFPSLSYETQYAKISDLGRLQAYHCQYISYRSSAGKYSWYSRPCSRRTMNHMVTSEEYQPGYWPRDSVADAIEYIPNDLDLLLIKNTLEDYNLMRRRNALYFQHKKSLDSKAPSKRYSHVASHTSRSPTSCWTCFRQRPQ